MKRALDIAVISDVHLGTYECHAKELLNYLGTIAPRILILNGDFIDIWQSKKKYFPETHVQVLQKVMDMSNNGTKVYYITGNHDDALRAYSDFSTGNIHLRDKLVLQLNGEKYWIFHGDVFDVFMKYSTIMAKLGGKGYDLLIRVNRWVNRIRKRFGQPSMSFSKKVKSSIKEASKYINDFEETAIRLAAQNDYENVICGHIHNPCIRDAEVDGTPVRYMNSGDWVESLTALEYKFKKWTIYQYDPLDYTLPNPRLQVVDRKTKTLKSIKGDSLIEKIIATEFHN